MLDCQFFLSNGMELVPKKAQDSKRPTNFEYSLDVLNKTNIVGMVDTDLNEYVLYISAYTDQNSKVFEISEIKSENTFETKKDKKLREKEENKKMMDNEENKEEEKEEDDDDDE